MAKKKVPNQADLILKAEQWFEKNGWQAFPFQKKGWKAVLSGKDGLLNAPTGSGKTYAILLGALMRYHKYVDKDPKSVSGGLQVIWITPIRALTEEIRLAATRACEGMDVPWSIKIRTGDTDTKERSAMTRRMPEILITTPESLHLMMAQKDYDKRFRSMKLMVVDEWHELLGSKRGVLAELALSRMRHLCPDLATWAISATIGNMDEALDVFAGPGKANDYMVIKAKIKKKIEVESIIPDDIETLPWAGHLGIKMLEKVIPVIRKSKTSIIFTNTRSQAEIWYQKILNEAPDLAGVLAMHHGSISKDIRLWVETALHEEKLKAVVSTSSLDLGVDFRPVETIIQIGSPKGVARFMQRAGRSGHHPGATSRIYFVPTHSLELIEASAIRLAIKNQQLESRIPYIRSFDVLAQYLVTLAVSNGFRPGDLFKEIKQTHCFESISAEEWNWILQFITYGGDSLQAYDEFRKVEVIDGLYKVNSRKVAFRHRLSIGAIVSDQVLKVKFISGGFIGTIEEWFISALNPGDVFTFAGRILELVRINGLDVLVRKSKRKSGKVPSWMGGRMSLSANMSDILRQRVHDAIEKRNMDEEIRAIQPLIQLQEKRSHIPRENEFLIEVFQSRQGHHAVFYPFEGRFVHEALAGLLAYRTSLLQPVSFSMAYNDYGFELLSSKPIPVQEMLDNDFFTPDRLYDDLLSGINSAELARRTFRDIASISGLVFTGYPGREKSNKHLQASSGFIFQVFQDYDPENLLLRQAYDEVLDHHLEVIRLQGVLNRIQQQEIRVTYPEKPTPFAFPVMVDRLRESLSTEKLEDRVKKMTLQFE